MDESWHWVVELLSCYEVMFVEALEDSFLGGVNSNTFFIFHPDLWGNSFQFDYCNIFQMGWFNHQPVLR